MISYARQDQSDQPAAAAGEDHIAPAPRVSVQAFCEPWRPRPRCRRPARTVG